MMANPEGTQQLRDRDLEFMFYDEAQVGCAAVASAYLWPTMFKSRSWLAVAVAVS